MEPNPNKAEVIEDFYGVYLLYCLNPKHKGRTYIGYTRDPNRRLKQHNRGTWAGGAWRTSNKGPWKMALIVHGFPNNISALRFEWAWQNPTKTTRLQHLNLKKVPRKESEFNFQLRVMSEMLRVGPWCRLPLTVRWLEMEYFTELPPEKQPPAHIKIINGPLKTKNLKKATSTEQPLSNTECLICSRYIQTSTAKITCTNPYCDLIAHIGCMANFFLKPGEYVPVNGTCPFCQRNILWGDLVRKMKGCGDAQELMERSDDDEESDDGDGFGDGNCEWIEEAGGGDC